MNATTLPPALTIGLIGRGHTGKNSVGRYLVNNHDFLPIAITDPLYGALGELLIDPNCLSDATKDQPIEGTRTSGRELLQHLGDWTREKLGPDILWRHAEVTMAQSLRNRIARDFVFTDLRTADEILWIWERGGYIWQLQNSGAMAVNEHPTEHIEQAIDTACYRWGLTHPSDAHRHTSGVDWILANSGTLEQLHEQVDQALAAIGRAEFESNA